MSKKPMRPERLVRARLQSNMTIYQVAKALGVSYKRWWYIEQGMGKPTNAMIARFSVVVGIPVDEIKAMPGSYPKKVHQSRTYKINCLKTSLQRHLKRIGKKIMKCCPLLKSQERGDHHD